MDEKYAALIYKNEMLEIRARQLFGDLKEANERIAELEQEIERYRAARRGSGSPYNDDLIGIGIGLRSMED